MGESAAPGFDDSPSFTVNFKGAFESPQAAQHKGEPQIEGDIMSGGSTGKRAASQEHGEDLSFGRAAADYFN